MFREAQQYTQAKAYFQWKSEEIRVVKESTITSAGKEFTSGSDAVPQGKGRKLHVFVFIFNYNPFPFSRR